MIALATAEPARHPSPTARASELAHVIFERPDLARAEAFLSDFGLAVATFEENVVYLRGTAASPYCYRIQRGREARFIGTGFCVETREELERLALLQGASAIEPNDHPGGGDRVVLRDPSGFVVEVLHGRGSDDPIHPREPLAFNVGSERKRINDTQRSPVGPSEVVRLGHVVLEVADYQATCAWYAQHLGLIPSDVQVLPDGSPAVAFMRLDLGETPADHHALAIAQALLPALSHVAFEVVDADAVGMGQRVLRERGWKHVWGIGRHILGSQIFDYWEDAWGTKHEHYCDGDVFTAGNPMGIHPVSREAMAQWGQPMPPSFTRPRLSLQAIVAAARNVLRSPDLTVNKALTLARIFG